MDLILNEMVIHKFIVNKCEGQEITKILDLSDKIASNVKQSNDLIKDVFAMYSRRPSKRYGSFEHDVDNYPMSRYLKDSIEGKLTFLDASRKMMEHFKLVAPNTATTAHVIFANIKHSDRQYLIIFLMNDALGSEIIEHDIVDSITLDRNSMRFAGRIDITSWSNGEERYISFLRGKGNASQYFQKFLGCDDAVEGRVATNSLRKAVEQFTKDSTMTRVEKNNFFNDVHSYLKELARNNTPFDAEIFANKFSPENPQLFITIFQNDEFKVPDKFIPHPSALKSLIRIKGQTPEWALEFDRKAIHENKISYNSDNNTIILTSPPDYLIDQIKDEVEEPAD